MKKFIGILMTLCMILHIIACCLYISTFLDVVTGQVDNPKQVDDGNEAFVFEDKKTDKERLIGKWEIDDGSSNGFIFYEDGILEIFEYGKTTGEGTWNLIDGKLFLKSEIETLEVEYELNDDLLTLYDDAGNGVEMVRK